MVADGEASLEAVLQHLGVEPVEAHDGLVDEHMTGEPGSGGPTRIAGHPPGGAHGRQGFSDRKASRPTRARSSNRAASTMSEAPDGVARRLGDEQAGRFAGLSVGLQRPAEVRDVRLQRRPGSPAGHRPRRAPPAGWPRRSAQLEQERMNRLLLPSAELDGRSMMSGGEAAEDLELHPAPDAT